MYLILHSKTHLDEEKSKHIGLAQQSKTVLFWLIRIVVQFCGGW
jgi:hypothetical protein